MGLNQHEINQLIAKLRDRYSLYEKKYNRTWFNTAVFEERLNLAVQKKMNLEGFILSEISHFEKLKNRYDKKKGKSSFSDRVDAIIDEHAASIKKYPPLYFHPDAHLEMVHCYGAMKNLATGFLPVLRIILKESSHKNTLNELEDKLGFLAVPHGTRPAKRIFDHILVLSRPPVQRNELDIEKDKNNYLREAAFLLHEITAFCTKLMESRDPDWDYPLRFDRLHVEGETRKRVIENFSGFTGYGSIMKIQEETAAIIEDFRLGAFKGPRATAF